MDGRNNFPKLHNAMWPGLVGKGPDSEPPIGLDEMLDLTAATDVGGIKFEGVDLFLAEPHTSIDSSKDEIKRLADKIAAKNLEVGSVVAPVWPPVGGGSAMGSETDRQRFVDMVRKACGIAWQLRELGIRKGGVVRIDSAASVEDWAKDPARQYSNDRRHFPARLRRCRRAWRTARCRGRNLLGRHAQLAGDGRSAGAGEPAEDIQDSRPTWHIRCSIRSATTPPNPASCLLASTGRNRRSSTGRLKTLTDALRPWTNDFHVAQNDATVKGMGTHDKTGRHCLVNDPNGKLDVVRVAGYWLRDAAGKSTHAVRHICWDGCMFPNAVMRQPQTWNDVLKVMIDVRDAHGWRQ